MHLLNPKTIRGSLAVLMLLSLIGCKKQELIYQWEDYQPQVYAYLKSDQQSPEEQIHKMEQGLEKIKASEKQVPPGYHAHLGLLYATAGRTELFVEQINTEKSLFPESASYMDFLLRNQQK